MTRLLSLLSVVVVSWPLYASGAEPRAVEYYEDYAGGRAALVSDYVESHKNRGGFQPEVFEVRGTGERSNRWITKISKTSVTIFRPKAATGGSVLICPGGGYRGLSFDNEGAFVAKWLNERGVTAGVLKYPTKPRGEGGRYHVGEQNAFSSIVHQGVRLMKDRVGGVPVLMGFSAGGHLAAMAANNPADGEVADGLGPYHGIDGRVQGLALIYPVITMKKGVTHEGSRRVLLGDNPTEQKAHSLSAENSVGDETPPTFLVHSTNDKAVPVENSLLFYKACRKQGVPVEMHLYAHEGHGYGMWCDKGTVAEWPRAFEKWLTSLGVIAVDKAVEAAD